MKFPRYQHVLIERFSLYRYPKVIIPKFLLEAALSHHAILCDNLRKQVRIYPALGLCFPIFGCNPWLIFRIPFLLLDDGTPKPVCICYNHKEYIFRLYIGWLFFSRTSCGEKLPFLYIRRDRRISSFLTY